MFRGESSCPDIEVSKIMLQYKIEIFTLLNMPLLPKGKEAVAVVYAGAVGTLGGELLAGCVCAVESPFWYNPKDPNPMFPSKI